MDFSAIVASSSKVTLPCPAWLEKCEMVLGTPEMLAGVVDKCIAATRFGLDTEGTGKDTRVYQGRTQSELVGFSVAPTPDVAYYFPLAHKQSPHLNIPFTLFEREFRRLFKAMEEKRTRALLFNAPFDQEMISYCGAQDFDPWDELGGWEDGHLLVCLEDSGRKQTALKTVAEEDWGWEVIELESLFSPDERALPDFQIDFSRLDPSSPEVLWYTCQDALLHYRIYDDYHDRVVTNPRGPKARHRYRAKPQLGDPKVSDKPRTSQALIYQIEKACALATRWMTRNQVGIDLERARQLIEVGQQEWIDTVKALYAAVKSVLGRDVTPEKYKYLFEHPFVDAQMRLVDILKSCEAKAPKDREGAVRRGDEEYPGVYDINSPQQLGKLLIELQIPDLRITEASKQVGTTDEDIEAIADKHGDKFPSVKLIGRMREINKALSTWLLPLYTSPQGGSVAVSWKQMGTDTGRFATPKPKHAIAGWLASAFQTLPTDKGNRPECMRRIREVITGRNGRLIVSVDFSGVELRIVTSLSGEPKWVDAFFRCSSCDRKFDRGDESTTPDPPPPRCPDCGSDRIGDLHTGTAIEVLGASPEDPDWKDKRGSGKILNFALVYGGGGEAASAAIGCDKNEGWRLNRQFGATYTVLKQFWDYQHQRVRKDLYVTSAFGRIIPLLAILSELRGIVSEAERNSVNAPIQATSADITKISMMLIYREVKRRGWQDKVLLIGTVHDELVFEIDPSVLEEAVDLFVPLMCRNPLVQKLNWPIPLTSDVEIGKNWSVPWNLWAMRAGEVRFFGDKKVKKPEDAAALGAAWEELPTFPQTLLPYFKQRDLGYEIRRQDKAPAAKSSAPPWIALDAGSDLTEELADRIARAVAECRGTGPTLLRLRAAGDWVANWAPEEILVDAGAFRSVAEQAGLRWLTPN